MFGQEHHTIDLNIVSVSDTLEKGLRTRNSSSMF